VLYRTLYTRIPAGRHHHHSSRMGAAPSIPTDPSRTVQVIGAGFSRTGTVSMQMALEILLKGPVLHGGTQIIAREDAYCKNWHLAYAARHASDHVSTLKHVRAATRGFVGTTDLPTIHFIPELLELYPDAKVVLVTRDSESWCRSTTDMSDQIALWWLKYAMAPCPGWRWLPGLMDEFADFIGQLQRREVTDGVDRDGRAVVRRETTEEGVFGPHALDNYHAYVREVVPKEKLLEMRLGEGWEPLCKFLGVPVPDQPFPRANDSAALKQTAQAVLIRVAQVWVGILGAAGGIGYLGFRAWRGRP